jgi:hypothetical protein
VLTGFLPDDGVQNEPSWTVSVRSVTPGTTPRIAPDRSRREDFLPGANTWSLPFDEDHSRPEADHSRPAVDNSRRGWDHSRRRRDDSRSAVDRAVAGRNVARSLVSTGVASRRAADGRGRRPDRRTRRGRAHGVGAAEHGEPLPAALSRHATTGDRSRAGASPALAAISNDRLDARARPAHASSGAGASPMKWVVIEDLILSSPYEERSPHSASTPTA